MATYDIGEQWQVPHTQTCRYCGQSGLEWVLNKKTSRWELQNENGNKHTHQPPKHENEDK